MGVLEVLKRLVGAGEREEGMVGTLVEGPTPVRLAKRDGEPWREVLAFRLDTRPELEFRQVAGPLTAKHRVGDRVRVRYRQVGAGVATVEWVERSSWPVWRMGKIRDRCRAWCSTGAASRSAPVSGRSWRTWTNCRRRRAG